METIDVKRFLSLFFCGLVFLCSYSSAKGQDLSLELIEELKTTYNEEELIIDTLISDTYLIRRGSDKRCGIVKAGELLVPLFFKFQKLESDFNSLVLGINNAFGIYDLLKEEWLTEISYSTIYWFDDSKKYLCKKNDEWEILNSNGEKLSTVNNNYNFDNYNKTSSKIGYRINRNTIDEKSGVFDINTGQSIYESSNSIRLEDSKNNFFLVTDSMYHKNILLNNGNFLFSKFRANYNKISESNELKYIVECDSVSSTVHRMETFENFKLPYRSISAFNSIDSIRRYLFTASNNLRGVLDENFEETYPPIYKRISKVENSLLLIDSLDNFQFELFDSLNNEVSKINLKDIKSASINSKGYVVLYLSNKKQVILLSNGMMSREYDEVFNFEDNDIRFLFRKDNEIYFANGELEILEKYDFNSSNLKFHYDRSWLQERKILID